MARYDLYRTPDGDGYFLDVQADLVNSFNTRVVIPLMRPQHAPFPARRLNPIFEIGGRKLVMVTQFISAATTSELGDVADNLSAHHDEIVSALDMLFQGF
ncbi:toxin CcdB [Mesorhizobium albiziae]|uniref:Toxin CcdB n=1 Tax=Neomesorhizobium albiziae TaxID=335020 RepID=A0A1I3XI72_9HYPH|nr:CcdB family protein [Mesorhizobium albiziae]GLS30431.1 plasmid maintenance protein CcdB [Mesorhizobium albiziae]SFK19188.1 toxin CcdB [Mesorhizobium albiziae]